MITRMWRRALTGLLLTLGMIGATLTVTAAPASADAYWCLYTSQVRVAGVTVPTGYYCFSVIGSGTRVNFTSGSYNGPIIVNAAERVTFYDRYGRNYFSAITYSRPGNSYGYRYWRSSISGNAVAGGSVCGEMMAAGVTIGKICHRIA